MTSPDAPRAISLAKPVTIALVGGFLGAGKTTAIGALAAELIQRGKRVAVLTNDQAAGLVDTVLAERLGVPVEEVSGGCFCCRFEDMLDAVVRILPSEPDILLCEPVGSCTDMAATVLNPLKLFYPDAFRLAPFTVLADPRRVRESVVGEEPEPFGPEVGYVFRKQLEEADALMLSKLDTLDVAEADRLSLQLEARYARPVMRCSAVTDEGIEAWAAYLLSGTPAGGHVLADIDYDTYATGEALLGWLNATVRVTSDHGIDGARLLASLLEAMRAACAADGAEIAHLKAALDAPGAFSRAHLTSTSGALSLSACDVQPREAQLILNARIGMEPERLRRAAEEALRAATDAAGAHADIETLRSFSPGYPTPPYRMPGAAG
jgi:Ni2+-binding GTPase involved in maturation of urease and hydrogenase